MIGTAPANSNTKGASSGVPDVPGLYLSPSPHRVYCGDIDIRIDRDGRWHYQGSPIGRHELVCLFASVLQRDDAGDFWMVTPAEMGRIRVEDAPFMAVEMCVSGQGREQVIGFRTNLDQVVEADAAHPIRVETDPETAEPSPYVLVRDRLEARLTRAVFYDLVALGTEEEIDGDRVYGVWSRGTFFPMGNLRED